jgi:putative copper resistance protein D
VASLTSVLSYLDVLLRGAVLAAQAVAIGGIAFALLVLGPAIRKDPELRPLLPSTLRMSAWAALAVVAGQCFALFVLIGSLSDGQHWLIGEVLDISFSRASVVHILGCLGVAAACCAAARRPTSATAWAGALASAGIVVGAAAYTSHASARLDGRTLLLWVDVLHQLAADVWIGGLIHLLTAMRRAAGSLPASVLKRFSPMALGAVAGLVVSGGAFSIYYVGGTGALYGTSYGAMLVSKVLLFGGLLVLGGMNFLSARLLGDVSAGRRPIRWFLEAEVGLGITVLFIAASLTSLPPAADVPTADRASLSELAGQFTPRWPRLTSPTREELPASDDPLSTRSQEDIAWSEYNHHVAGILVLAIGILAVLEHTGRAPWARHWPLLFIGLAGFLFARDDPEAWPFGPLSLWEGLAVRTILQHYIFVVLVFAFGIFEWLVRTGRLRSSRPAFVFPLLSAVGAGLLLAHSHSLESLKTVYLVEITHLPLGVLGCCVGWARWLELRLPPPDNRASGWVWSLALILIGALLLLYRES